MKEWFALHTRPYSERKVASRLERHDIETFVPETPSTTQQPGQASLPYFPGYLFVCLDMGIANPNHWRFTPGVRYIISYGDEPIPIADELIRAIRKHLRTVEERKQEAGAAYRPGDRVRITSGPLKDMIAIFEAPTGPSDRVSVLLEVINRYQRLRVSQSALEKVDTDREHNQGKRPRRTRGRGRRVRS